jgi:hypothetical protein
VLREEVRQLLESAGEDLRTLDANAVVLDLYLWDLSKAEADAMAHVPIHRTRCPFY